MNRKLKTTELDRINVETFKASNKTPLIVVLDNIRSLNNIGSVFRTADAFLIEAVYLCGITAQPPHRDIRKTALGATESVAWKYFATTDEAFDALETSGHQIIAIEQAEETVKLDDFQPVSDQKYALVMGNEVEGVQQHLIDRAAFCMEIPQFGTKHSLNISVCTGVVLWDFFSKLRKTSN